MRQIGTHDQDKTGRPKTSIGVLARDALIVFAITGLISVAVGALPRFN